MSAARWESAYRALLRLYPRAFRRRYETDMLEFYRERMRRARDTRAAVRAWRRILPDLVGSAAAEHVASLRRATSRFARETSPEHHVSPHRPEDSMSNLSRDLRFAVRDMRRHPRFTAIVVATLALGIGANTAIFGVVNAVLLRPLPYTNVDRIVTLANATPYSTVSEPEFMDYRRGIPALSKLAAYNFADVTLGMPDESIRASGSRVSSDFFAVLGTKAILGRTFAPDEFLPTSRARVTIISHALWQQRFGADRRAVGSQITINGRQVTIIGVMPSGFAFPSERTSFWTPWRLNPDSLWTRNNHYLSLIGTLAPGASATLAQAQAQALNRQWMRDYPETYNPKSPISSVVVPLQDFLVGATRPYLVALLAAVAVILLIACVNVANLLLARGEARRREIAIRFAMGASRRRVIGQLLTESIAFATIGAALGIFLAWIVTRALVSVAPHDIPRLDQVGVDARVILFTIALTMATALLFGVAPALRDAAEDSGVALRSGRAIGGSVSGRARRVLVVAEVTLSVVLLSGAALLIRSLIELRAIDLGFDPSGVLTMSITLPPKGYTDTTADDLYRRIVERVRSLPGVRSAALDGALPISSGDSDWSIMIDGHVVSTIAEAPSARPQQVTPDYFRTMSIRVVRGRAFTEEDRMGAPPVVVINETMARRLWPGVDPIGHRLKMFNPASPWATIVGVVADVKSRGVQATIPPTMTFPLSQSAQSAYYMPPTVTLVVKTAGDPSAPAPAIRAAIRAIDPLVPVTDIATMRDIVGDSIASRTFTTVLLGGFAALALLLAGVGIYGVIATSVSQRTFEMGVRLALGASGASVMRLVMRDTLRMTAAGVLIGLFAAPGVGRSLRSLLVGVGTVDPGALAGVVVILTVVAATAAAVPARRAMRVSPTEALRDAG